MRGFWRASLPLLGANRNAGVVESDVCEEVHSSSWHTTPAFYSVSCSSQLHCQPALCDARKIPTGLR